MTPGSAQQAAMRILLEDIEPLVQRTEEVAATLKAVERDLHSELVTLNAAVRQGCEMQPLLLEAGRTLTGAAGRIERGARLQTSGSGAGGMPRAAAGRAWMFASILVSALLSSTMLALAGWMLGADVLEYARAGQALKQVWPTLDADTRAKVQQALDRR